MGSLYRSEEMRFCQVHKRVFWTSQSAIPLQMIVERDAAFACVAELGKRPYVQFKDVSATFWMLFMCSSFSWIPMWIHSSGCSQKTSVDLMKWNANWVKQKKIQSICFFLCQDSWRIKSAKTTKPFWTLAQTRSMKWLRTMRSTILKCLFFLLNSYYPLNPLKTPATTGWFGTWCDSHEWQWPAIEKKLPRVEGMAARAGEGRPLFRRGKSPL